MKRTELKQIIKEIILKELDSKMKSQDEFFEKYHPEFNKIELKKLKVKTKQNMENMCSWSGCMYETYGEDLKYVEQQPKKRVWTILETDDGNSVISAGLHTVNRMGYLITKEEWSSPNEEYEDKDYDLDENKQLISEEVKSLTFAEIKPIIIKRINDDFRPLTDWSRNSDSADKLGQKWIHRLNARNPDLIDLRDIICSFGFDYVNKAHDESYKDFRNSGKVIDAFKKTEYGFKNK